MRRAPIVLADLTEKEWQRQVVELAAQLGWKKTYHVYDSRRSHSGFPDLVLVRDRIVFAELKREKTRPTDDQIEWLDRMAAAGAEVYLWRPSDLDDAASVMAGRWRYVAQDILDTTEAHVGPGLEQSGVWWVPAALWIPGFGRADGRANEQQTLGMEGADAA